MKLFRIVLQYRILQENELKNFQKTMLVLAASAEAAQNIIDTKVIATAPESVKEILSSVPHEIIYQDMTNSLTAFVQ